MQIRKYKNFMSFFDEVTGNYMRTGLLKDGKDTGTDPFMSPFPELLDIGIMGHCIHGKTGLCVKAGVECYQDGLHASNPNMTLSDFENIVNQCKGKTYQFALGGCGDPDQHEHFEEILKLCRQANIVANFTTSGYGFTTELANLCKKYCGAVAVSWYRSQYTIRAINLLLEAGVKTNIHYVLNRNTIIEALEMLSNNRFPAQINAIIFLLHKPVGLGSKENMINNNNIEFKQLLKFIASDKCKYKIGFDSCTVPALLSLTDYIDMDSLDTCEAARWSAYITSDMQFLPCSFDNQKQKWSVSLKNNTIDKAWNSKKFNDFRQYFQNSCPDCQNRLLCLGGCPICPEIVLCNHKK